MIRILLLSILLAGCNATAETPPPSAEPAPSPEIIKRAVKDYVRENFFDPYSVRDAQLSPPTYSSGGLQLGASGGWTVCLRANAKNRMGGYTGLKSTALTIRGGKVVSSLDDARWHCDGQSYSPFPDLT